MQTLKTMPWWLILLTGLVILVAGIFLAASPKEGLGVLTFLLGAGVLGYGLFNVFMAYRTRDDNRLMVPFLIHGLLNLVMFLLVITIYNTPAHLGVILASWFIIFGLFRILYARQDADKKLSPRVGALLLLIGVVLLILPFVVGIDHVLFLAIAWIIIGVVRSAQGILVKINSDKGSGRTDLR